MTRHAKIAAALALTAPVTLALADGPSIRPTTYVVTRPAPGIHSRVAPAPVVELPVGQRGAQGLVIEGSAVYPTLGRLVLANSATIYIDPLADYQTSRRGRLDENHTIVQAQNLLRSRLALRTRTITNPLARAQEEAARPVVPRAIIEVPRTPKEEPAPKVALSQ